jgi:catechol 2,3-dioxygenase-like lactoylglutathione lyase family enzyme
MENLKDEISVNSARVAKVDMKLEVVVIPVSDVDRASQFYTRLGWRQDVTPPGSGVVQFTPPGSACSIQFGRNLSSASPGSVQRTYLIVSDIEAARDVLVAAGVEVDDIFTLVQPAQSPARILSIGRIVRSPCSAIPTATPGR